VSEQIWSSDADAYLLEPRVFECVPAGEAVLVSGTDGVTDAAGKVLTSVAVGSGFVTAGVGEDSLENACTHFLEIRSGEYKGFYRISEVAADSLTLDRPIAASQTSLSFQVRTLNRWHAEAHKHYQDHILRLEGVERGDDSGTWEDDDLHGRSQRLLRDLCVSRVLGKVFRGATRKPGDLWDDKAKHYEAEERKAFTSIATLEKDTDDDGQADERTSEWFGTVEAGIG